MKLVWVLLWVVGSEVNAQNVGDVFGGISYIQTSIKDESSQNLGTFKPTVVGLGLAYVVMDNVALEVNAFDGSSDASVAKTSNTTYTVKIKNGYSIGVRPFIAFNAEWGAYAKLGRQYGTQTTVFKKSVLQISTDSTYSQTVYGLGISYNINPKWGVSSEYVWTKKGESDTTQNASIGIGIRYKF
jgi:outer membrane autotransporter protein